MSWSDTSRRSVLAGLAVGILSACQFRPVYGPGGAGDALAGRVIVDPPNGTDAFTLAQALEDRLGPPVAPRYRLTFGLDLSTDGIAITASQDTTRLHLVGRADWTLGDAAGGGTVASGRAESFTSYSATGTAVATRAAERDAIRRLMQILSDRIMADLLTTQAAAP